MDDVLQEPDHLWRSKCTLKILDMLENRADPFDDFLEWIAEAQSSDQVYIEFAMKTWLEVQNINALERERLRYRVRTMLSHLGPLE